MFVAQKRLAQKNMTLWTVAVSTCNKDGANCCISKNLSVGIDADISIVSQNHLERKPKALSWEKFRLGKINA